MKTDLYTKAVLTIIAVMLSVIAAKQFSSSVSVVSAEEKPVHFAVGPNGNFYFWQEGSQHIGVRAPNGARAGGVNWSY